MGDHCGSDKAKHKLHGALGVTGHWGGIDAASDRIQVEGADLLGGRAMRVVLWRKGHRIEVIGEGKVVV